MKLIVNQIAEIEVDSDMMEKEVIIFLLSKGFSDIKNLHGGKEDDGTLYWICQAQYYGKLIFKEPKEYPIYDKWVGYSYNMTHNDYNKRVQNNADILNELCRRNGREI